MNNTETNLTVFNDLKNCFKILSLPVEEEVVEGQFQHFGSNIKLNGCSMLIRTIYDPDEKTVILGITFSHVVPPEKIGIVCELINHINILLDMNHFAIDFHKGVVAIRNGLFVTDETLNIDQFHMFLKKLVGDARTYFNVIADQVFSDLKPQDLLTKFLKDNQQYWK